MSISVEVGWVALPIEGEIRTGDTVLHRPSGETWVVAYVEGDCLAWCGWPSGRALVSDCDLVEKCTDDAAAELLLQMAAGSDHRGTWARRRMGLRE